MGRRKKGARVLGPYEEKRKRGRPRWRVVQVDPEGTQTTHYAASQQGAEELVKACWIDLGVPLAEVLTISHVVQAFVTYKEQSGAWGPRTVERTGADLKTFAAGSPAAPIECVNVMWVRSYLERISHLALASQRSRFHAVTEFLGWVVRRGYLKSNPCDPIDPADKPWLGRRARRRIGRGKPQLRNATEVQQYLDAARQLRKTDHRVAAVLPLVSGLRSGEVRHLRVGDVDFTAMKLWIRDVDDEDDVAEQFSWNVKTAASRRTVDLPRDLLPEFRELTEGRAAEQLVFESNRHPGRPWERKWLNRMVKRVCGAAGVRVVCAHGLRDTYTSLLTAMAGLSPVQIAELVGHGDDGQTARRHYIGAPEHRPDLRLVVGGRSSEN